MKLPTILLFAAVVVFASSAANAQNISAPGYNDYANVYNRPTVSPYLLLLNNTQPGAYQYLVRPNIEASNLYNRSQNLAVNEPYRPTAAQNNTPGFQQARSQATTGANVGIRPTGHQSTSLNMSHYYNYNTGRR